MTIGQRLRVAMARAGLTQKEVARRTGLEPATVSDVVNERSRPSFDTVERMVAAIGTTFADVFDEPRIYLSTEDAALTRAFRFFLDRLLENDAAQKAVAATTITIHPSRTRRRKAKVPPHITSQVLGKDMTRDAPRRSDNHEVQNLPTEIIPEGHYRMGVRRAFKVLTDALLGDGVLEGAIIYVHPTIDVAAADGEIVVGLLNGTWYLKRLDLRGGQRVLRSTNPRYPALTVTGNDDFTLFGVAVFSPIPE